MDWQLAISRNREALLRIIVVLFALAGLAQGRAVLPRRVYHAVLCILRPAESAVRRLIIIAARGLVLRPRRSRAAPVNIIVGAGAARIPSFCLIDPLKRFVPFAGYAEDADAEDDDEDGENAEDGGWQACLPRISVPGLFDPAFAPLKSQLPDGTVNAQHIARRLQALKLALENLPAQARRLARWQARRPLALQLHKPTRISPFRPGFPPGHRARHTHEVHGILRECHLLMLDTLAAPDTS
jgi:hypothetical protein